MYRIFAGTVYDNVCALCAVCAASLHRIYVPVGRGDVSRWVEADSALAVGGDGREEEEAKCGRRCTLWQKWKPARRL